MANVFASTSNAVGTLKIWYAGPIVSQFNDMIPLWKNTETGKEKWNGLQVNRPLKVRRNPGIGATSDGGLLPSIGKQTTIQAIIGAKFNYLRFGLTGPMIKASQGDKGSFVNYMSYEMEEGVKDLKKDVNRQLYWNGDGTLATVAANALASNVITVTGRESTEDGSKFLDIGMVIDIVSAGVVIASGVTITDMSGTATATLTLSTAVTVSANDVVTRTGAYNMEIQGLLTTQDGLSTSVYGVDRSLYPVYRGNLVNANGGQLTLNLMKQAFNAMRSRGDGKLGAVFCDYDSERFYEKLLVSDKRYINKVKGDGTFSTKDEAYLDYASTPVVADPDAPTRIFFLDTKTWKKYVLAEMDWADESGAYMIAQTSTDAYEVRLRFFANMFAEKPSANAVLRNYLSP